MALGKRIQETLDRLGWQRADLMAKIPTLSPQALSNLIRRDSKRSEWDEDIAQALGVSVGWLVYGKADYTNGKVTDLPAREPGAPIDTIGRIVAVLKAMSPEGQLVALGRIEELAVAYPRAKANPASS